MTEQEARKTNPYDIRGMHETCPCPDCLQHRAWQKGYEASQPEIDALTQHLADTLLLAGDYRSYLLGLGQDKAVVEIESRHKK